MITVFFPFVPVGAANLVFAGVEARVGVKELGREEILGRELLLLLFLLRLLHIPSLFVVTASAFFGLVSAVEAIGFNWFPSAVFAVAAFNALLVEIVGVLLGSHRNRCVLRIADINLHIGTRRKDNEEGNHDGTSMLLV